MKLKKSLEVETAASVFERSQERPIIMTVEPSGLVTFRLKKTRRTYSIPLAACFYAAVRAEVESQKKGGAR